MSKKPAKATKMNRCAEAMMVWDYINAIKDGVGSLGIYHNALSLGTSGVFIEKWRRQSIRDLKEIIKVAQGAIAKLGGK